MRAPLRLLVLLLLIAPTLGAQTTSADPLADRLMRDVRTLASPEFGGRYGPVAAKTREWIAARFRALELKPLGESYEQPFVMSAMKGVNMAAVLPAKKPNPENRHIIVSAHYDHLGKVGGRLYPGAADDASGVAAMMECARVLRDAELDRDIVFVAFDLEERGLLGSFAWTKRPPLPLERCELFITCDILGRRAMGFVENTLFVSGWEYCPETLKTLQAVPHDGDMAYFWTDLAGDRADFVAFKRARIPHLFFSTGEYPDYHQPTDRPENLDPKVLATQTRVIIASVKALASAPVRWKWRDQPDRNLIEFQSVKRLANRLRKSTDPRLSTEMKAQAAALALYAARVVRKGEVTPTNRRWLVNVSRQMQSMLR